ncbi:MAG: hypothetical protein UT43_C0005G0002 [Parcubacteria group bacterium GW2011_GWC1_39_29]|nr:MAG: hypothetical protein UT43_C0005G0002 [Parcubacteria group bacterium GW2011_GWC1_39_29]
MANTINKKMLDLIAENFQKEFEAEQRLLEKMSESEKVSYMAVKASFNQ